MLKNATVDDPLHAMKAAGLIATTTNGTVVVDLGEGYIEGNLIIDVTALEVDTADEIYDIVFQLSSELVFTTATLIVENGQLSLSHATAKRSDSNIANAVGRYILPVTNLFNGTIYRYARLCTVVGGTPAAGINYIARLAKR